MVSFSQLWSANAAPTFAAMSDLTVTYYPEGGAPRTINADIDVGYRGGRWGRKIDPEKHHLTEYDWINIIVANDATVGMVNPKLGDAIEISGDSGGKWDFHSVVGRDATQMTVEWRRASARRAGQVHPTDL